MRRALVYYCSLHLRKLVTPGYISDAISFFVHRRKSRDRFRIIIKNSIVHNDLKTVLDKGILFLKDCSIFLGTSTRMLHSRTSSVEQ